MELEDRRPADIRKIARVFWRRRGLFTVPFMFAVAGAVSLAFTLPRVYESTCLLVVERPAVVTNLLEHQVPPPKPGDLIQALKERMLNWRALANVIKKVNLAPDVREEDIYRFEDIILTLKKNIVLRVKGTDLVQVSHRGRDPELNAKIVEELVSDFLERRLSGERAEAQQAYRFLDDELVSYRKELEASEAKLRIFRERYGTSLPDVERAHYSGKSQTENRLIDVQEGLGEAERRLLHLREQRTAIEKTVVAEVKKGANPKAQVLQEQLARLEVELAALRVKYRDRHPAVVDMRDQIKVLQKRLEQEQQQTVSEETTTSNPLHQEISRKIFETQAKVESFKSRKAALQARIIDYEEKVRSLPQREQDLARLQRDYEVKKELYNHRLLSLDRARIAKQLTLEAKTARFTIVEPARPSYHPVAPKVIQIILLGVVAGLALGGGIVFLVESTHLTFLDVHEAQEALGIPILGVVQHMDPQTAPRPSRRLVLPGATLAAAALIIGVVCLLLDVF